MAETGVINRRGSLSSSHHDLDTIDEYRKCSLPNMNRQNGLALGYHHRDRRASMIERTPRRRESINSTTKEDSTPEEPAKMYIVVKYADNQSLIVNPMCSVVNLLSSIKDRTGHAQNKDMLIDLSDETGLIQDLEVHGRDYATKYLNSHTTYILMQKQLLDENGEAVSQALQQYSYIPLLERYAELYPNFRVHLSESQKKKLKPLKSITKSPSPAGKMGTTKSNSSLSTGGSKSFAGRPPRSSSRGRPKQ